MLLVLTTFGVVVFLVFVMFLVLLTFIVFLVFVMFSMFAMLLVLIMLLLLSSIRVNNTFHGGMLGACHVQMLSICH